MSIDAMKQALEAMRHWYRYGFNAGQCEQEMRDIDTAIEAAEKQEPAAWLDLVKVKNGMAYATTVKITSKQTPLYTLPQPAIPDGMVLVPVEPFNEALDILKRVRDGDLGNCVAYRMLIAAAPKPENSHD